MSNFAIRSAAFNSVVQASDSIDQVADIAEKQAIDKKDSLREKQEQLQERVQQMQDELAAANDDSFWGGLGSFLGDDQGVSDSKKVLQQSSDTRFHWPWD
ncbi:MAG TPA: hypothetical protein VFG11_02305 [Acidobacteriota bacterium]|nr:hypothetical protein [Acidobacteriota bacterium]